MSAIEFAAVSIFALLRPQGVINAIFFHFKNLAIDCTWEEWGEWSACPDECGISTVFRSREKNEHICGGVACTGKSSDKKIATDLQI